MAYIPNEWVLTRLPIAPTTRDILFYYCARADNESGETTVSVERVHQDLKIRKDHVDEHDRKLVREGFISIAKNENGGRIVRMQGAWTPQSDRRAKVGQVVVLETASQVLGEKQAPPPQNLGSPLSASPSFGNPSPKLGESSQNLGEVTQNLGKSSQNLGAHIGTTSSLTSSLTNHGADAPNPAQVIWTEGVKLLTATGATERSARSFLGGLVKKHSAETVNAALASAAVRGAADPKAYLVKVLENASKGGKGSDYGEELDRRARRALALFRTDWRAKFHELNARRRKVGAGIPDGRPEDGDREGPDAGVYAPA